MVTAVWAPPQAEIQENVSTLQAIRKKLLFMYKITLHGKFFGGGTVMLLLEIQTIFPLSATCALHLAGHTNKISLSLESK